jgi:hypothetical protein
MAGTSYTSSSRDESKIGFTAVCLFNRAARCLRRVHTAALIIQITSSTEATTATTVAGNPPALSASSLAEMKVRLACPTAGGAVGSSVPDRVPDTELEVGVSVDIALGCTVGNIVGAAVAGVLGADVGDTVGASVRVAVGEDVGESVVGRVDGAGVGRAVAGLGGIVTAILHQKLQHPPPDDADDDVQALMATGYRFRMVVHRSQNSTLAWQSERTSTLHSSNATQLLETPCGPQRPIKIEPVVLQLTVRGLFVVLRAGRLVSVIDTVLDAARSTPTTSSGTT